MKLKEKMTLHPIMTLLIMILITMVISGFLALLETQVAYSKLNANYLDYISTSVSVKSLFSLSGLKYIFTNTVSNFVAFTPLSSLIIVLIGIGVMEKSGFLKTAVTMMTKKASKNSVTFILVLISILISLIGDLSYIIMIPLSALLFYYGKRNPKIGIIASFAGLTCGSGISILLTSIDSALLSSTLLASHVVDPNYTIHKYFAILIMVVATVLIAWIITKITENIIAKRLTKYEFPETELEEEISIGRREMRGLIFSFGAAIIYMLVFIYNIIPGLPFSGNLLDYSQTYYIDKLFSYNSFFSNGFVFIVTILFVILGLFYGIGAKTIKNNKEFCDTLGHSLDGTGKTLVLIFFASTFISIFKQTEIGTLLVAALTNLLNAVEFSAIPLIILLFIIAAITTLVVPSSISKWAIISGVAIPVFMNAGLTPEFAQVVFRFGESMTMGLTPMLAYFVIYLAFLEKYNQSDKPLSLFRTLKYQLPYSLATGAILLLLLIVWYIIGLPIGISSWISL